MSASRPRSRLLLALALLACCVNPAAGRAANRCTGGGQPRPDDGGIGGTGDRPAGPDDDDGGIGGTGVSPRSDTGIIGTISGFASVCVGGMEIHYGADTVVQVDGQRATPAQLAVGQVVEVVATGSGSEMSARHIAVRYIVSGPVTRVDSAQDEIDVVGQTVQLSPLTRAGGEEYAAVAAAYPLHSFVQVSGMRRADGVVVASRVSLGAESEPTQLTGPVTQYDVGRLAIAGTPVRIDSAPPLAVGDEVHVVGAWDGSAVVARSIESISPVPFDGRVHRLDIEGYARETTAGQLQIGAFAVELGPPAALQVPQLPVADARIRIQAVVQDRHVIVERIGIVDELPSLPPLPQRDIKGWNGGGLPDWKRGAGEPPPMDASGLGGHDLPPPRDDADMKGPEPPAMHDVGVPPHPDRIDHPPMPQVPDRPPVPERPPVPDRPPRPDPPPCPDRPSVPEHPPCLERPHLSGRP